MKLYYAPGACSLSPHIVLREAGLDFDLERVDLRSGTVVSDGRAFREINPKGYIPALELEDGSVLTEGASIVQHIADSNSARSLAPAPGELARARVNEWLVFISTELHKTFSPLFSPDAAEVTKAEAVAKAKKRFDHVEDVLADGRTWLTGDDFTVADAYLFTIANWAGPTGIGLEAWPQIAAYMDRVRARPAVHAALEAEGLLQPA